jgi:hypothetical protein
MRLIAVVAPALLLAPAFADEKETKPITPAEAAKAVDKKVTVEMEVKSVGKSEGVFFLNSEEDFRSEKNFTAFINKDGAKKFQEAKIDDPAATSKARPSGSPAPSSSTGTSPRSWSRTPTRSRSWTRSDRPHPRLSVRPAPPGRA